MKTTSLKNQVIDRLQWSTEEYEERLFLSILMWCQKYGMYPSVIQQLLANASVNRWYMREFAKCEVTFLKIADVMPNNVAELEGHYKACTAQMQIIYPKPLIEAIRRNKDFSNQFITNTPVFYAN
jgi:hypothetical protein